MLSIARREIERMRDVGLLQDRKIGFTSREPNYTVCNKFHKSRAKTYVVVETPEVLAFLEHWDACNLQEISKAQFQKLIDLGKLNEENVQEAGGYIPNALGYKSSDGRFFVQKTAKLLVPLGIWRATKSTQAN